MKRIVLLLLCFSLLAGCTSAQKVSKNKQHTATFLNLFDTVTTIVGYAESEEIFKQIVQPIHDELEHYHKLFDIYEEYDGTNNLKTVNDKASVSPVTVDNAILELLQKCKEYYISTNGTFNIAMGNLLKLWHDAREDGLNYPANAYLPDFDDLKNASLHMNPDDIVLDLENSTVFISDPLLKIDVGGIAKGWAVQKVCKNAPSGLLISVGGNVYATGAKDKNDTPWSVGITNPDGDKNLHILNIKTGSVVTSGSYYRAYSVDGKLYHHIIDPKTLYPGKLWTSVTIVCSDSGLADVLSTSLFLLDKNTGQTLLDKFDAEAMWVDTTGNKYYSNNFKDLIRN